MKPLLSVLGAAAVVLLLSWPVLVFPSEPEIPAEPEPVFSTETSAAPPETPPFETPPPDTEPPTTEPTTVPTTEPSPPPESVMLEIPFYTQRNILPTGCELVSAKMVLEYYTGEEIPMTEIVDNIECRYPQSVNGLLTGPHPEDAFIGNPWDPSGYGCFAPVLANMMNTLLPDEYVAINTTGTALQTLAETWLPQGTPVLIWATINMVNHSNYLGWYIEDENGEPTDEWYDWQVNEHCLVLVGYDNDFYYFNDPNAWQTPTRFGREIVETRYNSMGMYSIIVQESVADAKEVP